MDRPRIGIPLCLDDRGSWRTERETLYADRRYADAIDRAGGRPIHLPIQSDASGLVHEIDGLLIPGGDDFPSDTPLPDHVRLDPVAPEGLAFDEVLLDEASAKGLPVLGICYGMQLIARRRGGRIDAHLPTDRPEADCHRLPEQARHRVAIEAGSLLERVLETRDCEVNSLHHQAVRSCGRGLRAVAWAEDGVIEALESDPRGGRAGPSGFFLGVQWHPEKLDDSASARLFAAFLEACRSVAAAR